MCVLARLEALQERKFISQLLHRCTILHFQLKEVLSQQLIKGIKYVVFNSSKPSKRNSRYISVSYVQQQHQFRHQGSSVPVIKSVLH